MNKELGKGGMIGAIVFGLIVVAAVVYFAFFKNAGYTAEEAKRNEAQTKISDQNASRVDPAFIGDPNAGSATGK
jgi:hypothetical protein